MILNDLNQYFVKILFILSKNKGDSISSHPFNKLFSTFDPMVHIVFLKLIFEQKTIAYLNAQS